MENSFKEQNLLERKLNELEKKYQQLVQNNDNSSENLDFDSIRKTYAIFDLF